MIRDPVLRKALEPPTDLRDRLKFRELRETWFDRLRETKSATHKTVLTDADAQVLARLEWINTKLAPKEPEAKSMYRTVLITGDQAIHDAGFGVRPWGQSNQSFGELFLRHPRAYLDEPKVLSPPEDKETSDTSAAHDTQFDQWLDTWLGELNPRTDNFEKMLEDLLAKDDRQLADWVAPLGATRPRLVDQLRTRWTDYTKNLVLDRPLSGLEIKLAGAQERGVIQEYERLIDELSQTIDQQIRETWQRLLQRSRGR